MATCPTCRTPFEGDAQYCPRDGTPLVAAALADPLVGRELGGRYRLLERLGRGGMGTVYRAVHTLMDKRVAVKVLRGDHADDPEAVARFHREARSASRLDHEHCIRVTDFGQSDDGLLYLVMELLDGESLGALLRRGPLSASRAAGIASDIAAALQHAHEMGVVHRDLKPDNVFLARRKRGGETVKVLDFGLARIIGTASGGDVIAGPSITRAGVVFGTPEYMAPEQCEGAPIDARTDLYALGGILYHLLTGAPPFRAEHFLQLLSKQVEEAPEPPRRRRPEADIPPALEAIVLRCLAKPPDERFQTAAAVGEALAPFVDAAPSSQRAADETDTPPPLSAVDLSSEARATPASLEIVGPSLAGESIAPSHHRRGLVVGLGAAGITVAAVAVLAISAGGREREAAVAAPGSSRTAPVVAEPPLARARRLIDAGDLDGADRLLATERARGDGAQLQSLLGEAALLRGNRLGALAHFHRATRIAPDEADAHARLASMLALIGQRDAACREARTALDRDPRSSIARAATDAARCPKD